MLPPYVIGLPNSAWRIFAPGISSASKVGSWHALRLAPAPLPHWHDTMLIDFRTGAAPATIEADLCIIGSGAAGIALAVALMGTHQRVCILESGGLESESDTQSLYNGEDVGLAWSSLVGSRARLFGGTTNWWGGGCFPLARSDMAERSWVPYSGWPITREALDPWYELARPILRLPSTRLDAPAPPPPIAFDPRKLIHRRGWSSGEPMLGVVFRPKLSKAENLTILLHANLTEFIPDETARTVQEARFRSLTGKAGSVRARYFVLACGGIENARLLLLSNSVIPTGLGNEYDLVGRFFMDHPSGKLGTVISGHPDRLSEPYNRQVLFPGVVRPGEISLSPAVQQRQHVLNARLRPQDYEDSAAIPDGVLATRELEAGLHDGRFPGSLASVVWRITTDLSDVVPALWRRLRHQAVVTHHHIDLEGFFEQAPNPDSRVSLGDMIDPLGQRCVRMNWQLTDLDRLTWRVAAETFAAELARLDLGRVRLEPWLRDGSEEPPALHGVHHHLGTTRMSNDPRKGVVDANCRVHGIDNLYIAGSSVFPTCGWTFPTLTIVALALRLADHLSTLG